MSLISNVYSFKFFTESLGCLCSKEEVGRMPRRCAATAVFWHIVGKCMAMSDPSQLGCSCSLNKVLLYAISQGWLHALKSSFVNCWDFPRKLWFLFENWWKLLADLKNSRWISNMLSRNIFFPAVFASQGDTRGDSVALLRLRTVPMLVTSRKKAQKFGAIPSVFNV